MEIEKAMELVTLWVTTYSVKLVAAILILVIGKWLARKLSNLVSALMEKNKVDLTLVRFIHSILYYTLLVVVVIAAAGQLGINTASFLTIMGAAGLAVGLALKDSLSNFASGVMLILFRPYRVNDFVDIGGTAGKVVSISLFTTELNTADNKRVIVPNSRITSNIITNVTANETRRVDLVFGISYEDDIGKARQILHDLVSQDERVLKEPECRIAVSELANSSVNFIVRPWVKAGDYWDLYYDLTEKVKLAFDAQGITIPYPQQDVHLYKEKA